MKPPPSPAPPSRLPCPPAPPPRAALLTPLIVTAALAAAMTGCSRETPSLISNPRLMAETSAPTPPEAEARPLRLHSIELDPSAADRAGLRDWVAATGGFVDGLPDGRREIGRDPGRAWVDPDKDEVTLVVMADNGLVARARPGPNQAVEAAFIKGRARLRVPLRHAYAELSARTLGAESTLRVALEIEHDAGLAKGEIALSTPRPHELLASLDRGAVLFPGETGAPTAPPTGSAPPVLWLGPEPSLLPANPDLPLRAIDLVAVDRGAPLAIAPCPLAAGDERLPSATRAERQSREIRLTLHRRTSGATLGEASFPHPIPPCFDGDPRAVPPPPTALLEGAISALLRGERAPIAPPPPGLIATLAPLGPTLALHPDRLERLTTFVGLSPRSTEAEVARALGARRSSPAADPPPPVIALELDEALGALIDGPSGLLAELWVSGQRGANLLTSKNLDDPLLRLLDRPVADALSALGRPARVGEDFIAWTLETGALTTYVELHCEREAPHPCRNLTVGWIIGEDPHDRGDVPGAKPHHHSSHRSPPMELPDSPGSGEHPDHHDHDDRGHEAPRPPPETAP